MAPSPYLHEVLDPRSGSFANDFDIDVEPGQKLSTVTVTVTVTSEGKGKDRADQALGSKPF